ncbi:MAG: hypothetical protein JRI34_08415, partial [Deltaproteobacteria bacterium]|nr:hypothetical protein [Deltaproteobacteria bacterium]
SNQYVLPEIKIWKEQRNIEKSLQEIAVYQHIAKSDPEIYERIKSEINNSLRNRESSEQTTIRIRRIVNELVGKYLPRASDDAIFNYVKVMIQELSELTKLNPDLSYEFLFPQRGGATGHSYNLSPEMKKADLDALAEVIKTGSTNPVIIRDFSEAKLLLEKVFANLHKVYGDDLSLLRNPLASGIYKKKYCNITIALFTEIFELPKQKSCMVLRYMFSTIPGGAT